MHRIMKGDCVSQGTGFALFPTRTMDAGYVWLRRYHWVQHEWGWGFADEFRFSTEKEADTFYYKQCSALGM